MRNKYINLEFFVQLDKNKNLFTNDEIKQYISNCCGLNSNFNFHINEIEQISKFCKSFSLNTDEKNGFLYDLIIPNVNAEFDLIKIFNDKIVNIELKKNGTYEKERREQLIRNKFYLKYINKDIISLNYLREENKIEKLEGNNFKEIEKEELSGILSGNHLVIDLDTIYTLDKVLVSPFNDIERLVQRDYLLTNSQYQIGKRAEEFIKNVGNKNLFVIKGKPGVGKTLVLFDIMFKSGLKCCFVWCGILNKGLLQLKNKLNNIYIVSIKDFFRCDFKKYDLFIFDEVQRIYKQQLGEVFKIAEKNQKKLIFSFGFKQNLEVYRNDERVFKMIKKCNLLHSLNNLKNQIRTDENLNNFIDDIFYNKKKRFNAQNIDIYYLPDKFNNNNFCLELAKLKEGEYITYTPSRFNSGLDYQNSINNTHQIIGQEFDCVIVVLNKFFYYDDKLNLTAETHPNPGYSFIGFLYQALTRARKRIILVIENIEVYKHIQLIIKNYGYLD